MNPVAQLEAFLEVPELSMVGSAPERAAFIAVRLKGITVREAGQSLGVSKSSVTNLADQFQEKLAARMMELNRKRIPVSAEYRNLYRVLYDRLCEVRSENGNDDWDDSEWTISREDRAEAFGKPVSGHDE